MIVQLKDVSLQVASIIAWGKMPIPATMQTPEYFGLTIWVDGAQEPIIVTYATEEERDKEYDTIGFAVVEAGR